MSYTPHYLQNSFIVSTNGSLVKAQKISDFHHAALERLKQDAFFAPIYVAYDPIHADLFKKITDWKSASGIQEGDSLNIEQLLILLRSSKIKQWDIAIQNVYVDTTPEYKKILPDNRGPFQVGAQNDRINALTALDNALTGIAALAAVKTDVHSFLTNINAAIDDQKKALGDTNAKSAIADASRIIMCNAQYGNFGLCMNKYASNPMAMIDLFDWSTLRSANQVLFTYHHLKPLHVHFIVKHGFAAGDTVICTNQGTGEIWFYLADSKTAQPSKDKLVVPGNSSVTVSIDKLGDISHHFVLSYNPDATSVGSFEFEIE